MLFKFVDSKYLTIYIYGKQMRLGMEFNKSREFSTEAMILKVLGHPIRLKIVAGLCTKECNVKHIWECLELPQATVSQHLALLKSKGIIEGKRDGAEVHYSVISPLAKKIISTL
jgi:ArsR family transcriptional regulator